MGDAVGDRFVKRDYQRGNFMVQVGAFTVKENASRLRASLAKRYGNVSISTYDRGDAIYYRVRVGGAGSLKEAEKLKEKVDGEGMEATFVVAD
jgi:rare lipoprotein A